LHLFSIKAHSHFLQGTGQIPERKHEQDLAPGEEYDSDEDDFRPIIFSDSDEDDLSDDDNSVDTADDPYRSLQKGNLIRNVSKIEQHEDHFVTTLFGDSCPIKYIGPASLLYADSLEELPTCSDASSAMGYILSETVWSLWRQKQVPTMMREVALGNGQHYIHSNLFNKSNTEGLPHFRKVYEIVEEWGLAARILIYGDGLLICNTTFHYDYFMKLLFKIGGSIGFLPSPSVFLSNPNSSGVQQFVVDCRGGLVTLPFTGVAGGSKPVEYGNGKQGRMYHVALGQDDDFSATFSIEPKKSSDPEMASKHREVFVKFIQNEAEIYKLDTEMHRVFN
jgi:hypothetical protein